MEVENLGWTAPRELRNHKEIPVGIRDAKDVGIDPSERQDHSKKAGGAAGHIDTSFRVELDGWPRAAISICT